MLSILLQGDFLIFAPGNPDVFVSNKDFNRILRNPSLAKEIKKGLGVDKDIIIGRLGILDNGVYRDNNVSVNDVVNKRKELHFYESL